MRRRVSKFKWLVSTVSTILKGRIKFAGKVKTARWTRSAKLTCTYICVSVHSGCCSEIPPSGMPMKKRRRNLSWGLANLNIWFYQDLSIGNVLSYLCINLFLPVHHNEQKKVRGYYSGYGSHLSPLGFRDWAWFIQIGVQALLPTESSHQPRQRTFQVETAIISLNLSTEKGRGHLSWAILFLKTLPIPFNQFPKSITS